MALIQIREHPAEADGSNAIVAFEDRGEYSITISDPFSQQEEDLLEWYFEQHLRFPFVRRVDAQQAASSITTYGEAPFGQVFNDREAYATYRECTQRGVSNVQTATTADPVEAGQLADLLINYQVPIAILNACQSGKQVGNSETSLGSRLMQAGVQLVLAMSNSLPGVTWQQPFAVLAWNSTTAKNGEPTSIR